MYFSKALTNISKIAQKHYSTIVQYNNYIFEILLFELSLELLEKELSIGILLKGFELFDVLLLIKLNIFFFFFFFFYSSRLGHYFIEF